MENLLKDLKAALEIESYLSNIKHEPGTAWGSLEWSQVWEEIPQ